VQALAERGMGEWLKIGERKGWSDQQIGERAQEAQDQLFGAVLEAHLQDGNLPLAEAFLRDHQDRLSPQMLDQVTQRFADPLNPPPPDLSDPATFDQFMRPAVLRKGEANYSGDAAERAKFDRGVQYARAPGQEQPYQDIVPRLGGDQGDGRNTQINDRLGDDSRQVPQNLEGQDEQNDESNGRQQIFQAQGSGANDAASPTAPQRNRETVNRRLEDVIKGAPTALNGLSGIRPALDTKDKNHYDNGHPPKDLWQGSGPIKGYQDAQHPGFSTFYSVLDGVRATTRNLRSYYNGGIRAKALEDGKTEEQIKQLSKFNITNIVGLWMKEQPDALKKIWIKDVSKFSGIGPDQVIDLNNVDQMVNLLHGMGAREQGLHLPRSVYLAGMDAAMNDTPYPNFPLDEMREIVLQLTRQAKGVAPEGGSPDLRPIADRRVRSFFRDADARTQRSPYNDPIQDIAADKIDQAIKYLRPAELDDLIARTKATSSDVPQDNILPERFPYQRTLRTPGSASMAERLERSKVSRQEQINTDPVGFAQGHPKVKAATSADNSAPGLRSGGQYYAALKAAQGDLGIAEMDQRIFTNNEIKSHRQTMSGMKPAQRTIYLNNLKTKLGFDLPPKDLQLLRQPYR
jgi:hypothetical protein